MKDTRKNPDGSITVGIIPSDEDKAEEKPSAPKKKPTKPKTK